MSKLTAYANLGYHGLRTTVRRWMGGTRGLSAFVDNYREDRLPPLTPEERSLLGSIDGCLACGLCDAVARPDDRRHGLPGPSALPLSVSRHPPDYESLGPYLDRLEREDLPLMEAICPARIPFRRLIRFVREVAVRTRPPGQP